MLLSCLAAWVWKICPKWIIYSLNLKKVQRIRSPDRQKKDASVLVLHLCKNEKLQNKFEKESIQWIKYKYNNLFICIYL